MKRAVFISLCMLLITTYSFGQEEPNDKVVNFGFKAGFNSSMYLVSRFKIKDVTIDEIQNNYKIGYFGAFFVRLNLSNHYIQPEINYQVSRCEIVFDKLGSQHPEIDPDYASINSKIHSIEVPVIYGYNIIKKGPYGMSVFGGPKIRYMLNKFNEITFDNFDQKGMEETLYPLNISFTVGVAVSISRIFFDFRYEQGLHNISKSVIYDGITPELSNEQSNITFNRRDNVLSFSLGIMF